MTLITTPFGFKSTAEEVAEGIDLKGKTAIVTGGASGIGYETGRVLAKGGVSVVLAVRNLDVGIKAADEIKASTGNSCVAAVYLDLTKLESVHQFVANWDGPLDILVNNAGIMACPEEYTSDGYELQFATNHRGHFALTLGLHKSLSQAGNSRVVSVSSSAHQRSPVVFDDIHFRFRPYDPWAAYGQSKTANVLFAVEASKRWARDGIRVNSLMPGAIATNLQRHVGGLQTPPERRKTIPQGAATSVLLAVSPLLEGVGGSYFVDCNETETIDRRSSDFSGEARYALDAGNAERLWEKSLESVGSGLV